MNKLAYRWQKSLFRIFCIDARFNRMAMQLQLMLQFRKTLTISYTTLPFNQIDTSHHLSHRMLNLKTRIHFHEIKTAVLIRNELDCACTNVTYSTRSLNCRFTHRFASLDRHARRWCFFQNFLMTSLYRTITLKQRHTIALCIGKYLNLNMTWTYQIFFYQYTFITKARFRFALTGG